MVHATASTPISRIISVRELRQITSLSAATLWRMRRRGELPEPLRLTQARIGWHEDTIRQWLADRKATADTSAGAIASEAEA